MRARAYIYLYRAQNWITIMAGFSDEMGKNDAQACE